MRLAKCNLWNIQKVFYQLKLSHVHDLVWFDLRYREGTNTCLSKGFEEQQKHVVDHFYRRIFNLEYVETRYQTHILFVVKPCIGNWRSIKKCSIGNCIPEISRPVRSRQPLCILFNARVLPKGRQWKLCGEISPYLTVLFLGFRLTFYQEFSDSSVDFVLILHI